MTNITSLAKNFGKIKSVYNSILSEGLITKNQDKKKLFKTYLNAIKENKLLRLQFLVYTNIENKVESDRIKAGDFLRENLNLFSNINKEEIIKENEKILTKVLFEQTNSDDRRNNLYEDISTLIFLRRTPKNIDKIMESTNNIVDYIVNNTTETINEEINLPNSMLSVMMVDKYNEKYSILDEGERKLLKVLIESTEVEKKDIYKEIVRECIDMIDSKLDTNDLEIKDKLLKVKDKLLSDKYDINEDFSSKIIKINNLKNNLK